MVSVIPVQLLRLLGYLELRSFLFCVATLVSLCIDGMKLDASIER